MSNAAEVVSQHPSGFTIELEREGKIVRVLWTGRITLSLLREGFNATREFAAGRQLLGAISDFSHADSFSLSSDDVYALTEEKPVFETEIPRVTVSGTEHVFGMARMFELLSDGRKTGIHVVRTTEEAYSLLQLDNPEFYPAAPYESATPFALERDAAQNVLLGIYRGKVTDQVLLESSELSRRAIEFYKPKAAIGDFSKAEEFNVSSQCIQRLALFEPRLPGDSPIVMVAPAEHIFGMARMYEILSSSRDERIVVVRVLEHALEKLGLENTRFEPIKFL